VRGANPVKRGRGIASRWRRIRRNRLVLAGGMIVGTLLLGAVLAPVLASHDPLAQHLDARLKPGLWAGNWGYPLGTDELGRDVLSRVLYGARISLSVAFVVITLTNVIGGSMGVMAAYCGGVVDMLLMRVTDVLLAFPYIILAIALMAVLGQGVVNAIIAIALVNTPTVGRLLRSVTLTVKSYQFVEAAHVLGARHMRVLRKHVIPNLLPHLVVFSSLSLGETILYIAALGFLGLGISPPTPEWGAMVSQGKDLLVTGQWWPSAFPGAAIVLATLGFVLLGDGLRDALDPRMGM
jgi:peptide/nickel transport system permease protein